jgi:hypothetical protein
MMNFITIPNRNRNEHNLIEAFELINIQRLIEEFTQLCLHL